VALKTTSSTYDAASPSYDVHGNTGEETAVKADDASQDKTLSHTGPADTVHTLTTTTVADTTKDLGLHSHDALL
jgi:hypothetical protein